MHGKFSIEAHLILEESNMSIFSSIRLIYPRNDAWSATNDPANNFTILVKAGLEHEKVH